MNYTNMAKKASKKDKEQGVNLISLMRKRSVVTTLQRQRCRETSEGLAKHISFRIGFRFLHVKKFALLLHIAFRERFY